MRLFLFCLLVSLLSPLSAGQKGDDYLSMVPVFWKTLYPDGGKGLYCGKPFKRYDRSYNIEHVYPMGWVAKSLNCGKRKQCRERSARFNRIESDMHNMYPARKDLNKDRGSMPYGVVEGEKWVEAGCDLEIDYRKRRVEPQPASRGEIARAMLYMHDRYDLPLYKKQKKLLKKWHKSDPPSKHEKERNRRIARLQGEPNPWIGIDDK